ncbi:MAG: glucosamine-6-phosphate deaminase [Muribaculaceae bacterium]|nr:glucosamine-6-phosphate deaminase [Muribaculaceae bacterium]
MKSYPKITILPDEKSFDKAAADIIVARIKSKPDSVIGLSTGRTTGNLHRLVADNYNANPFDVSKVTFFGLDEVTGVDREYSGACYKMLKTEIVGLMPVPEHNFIMLPTMSDDFDRECKKFTDELDKRGGIDLLILGLGENGHLGFNQPGTKFGQTAWHTNMHPELEERIRRETGSSDPMGGITLGIKDIMHARRIVLVAKGKNKAEIVKQMLQGEITEAIPASILQLHPACEFLFDADAANLLTD